MADVWLRHAPIAAGPGYPIALDVIEHAVACCPEDVLLRKVAQAIAPAWEDFRRMGQAAGFGLPSRDELGGSDNPTVEQNAVFGGFATALRAASVELGVCFSDIGRMDHESLVFVQRIIRQSAVEGRVRIIARDLDATLAKAGCEGARVSRAPRQTAAADAERCAASPLAPYLAVSSQGLPASVIAALGHEEEIEFFPAVARAPAEPIVFASPKVRRRVLRRLDASRGRALHGEIFDAWHPGGWGYLRRGAHAAAAKDLRRILAQHIPYVYGMSTIGMLFVYRQFVAVERTAADGQTRAAASLGAARAVARLWGSGTKTLSIRHYGRAFRGAATLVERIRVGQELANAYATSRDPVSLGRSRELYERLWSLCARVSGDRERRRLEVVLCNGQALVEYHQGRNEAALDLELRALRLVDEARRAGDDMEVWARPLIHMNTAKLLHRRFGDDDSAKALLRDLFGHGDPAIREGAHINYARLDFDNERYGDVVRVLAPLYEENAHSDFDEQEELLGRTVFALSLLRLHERRRARRQVDRIRWLGRVLGLGNVARLCDLILDATGPDAASRR